MVNQTWLSLPQGTGLQAARRRAESILYMVGTCNFLSRSYATDNLNFDGKPDLVVTAPGYGSPGSLQEGRIYIVYGRYM